ncbi:MAG: hypothetical protein ACKOZL_00630 [Actinomycetes bacterium]
MHASRLNGRGTPALRVVVTLGLTLGLAACGGSASNRSTTVSTVPPPGASGRPTTPPPALPYSLGDRAALGDWELAVDAATIGATTTVNARLVNVSGRPVRAPGPGVFVLRDRTADLPTPALIAGLPAEMAADVDVPITITFAGSSVPADPYLHWNGTSESAVEANFRLTPGEPTVPLD